MTPEQKLARAVILQAVKDAAPKAPIRNPSDDPSDYKVRVESWKDARNFLAVLNEDLMFWCEMGVISPSLLVKWMNNKIQAEALEDTFQVEVGDGPTGSSGLEEALGHL